MPCRGLISNNKSREAGEFMKVLDYAKYKGFEEDFIFQRVAELLESRLPDAVGQYGCDLHNFIFNEEGFIYTNNAENACDSVGVWSAIRLVKQYEIDNFGESNTEIEPCKIANMLVYIYGEFLLAQVEHLRGKAWDRELTKKDLQIITKQIATWAFANLPSDADPYRRTLDGLVWDYFGAY